MPKVKPAPVSPEMSKLGHALRLCTVWHECAAGEEGAELVDINLDNMLFEAVSAMVPKSTIPVHR